MSDLTVHRTALPATTQAGLAAVRGLEAALRAAGDFELVTDHVLHAGVYHRTVKLAAGSVITGALVKVPTTLVVSGDATVSLGEGQSVRVRGFHVLAASAGRKQSFVAHTDTVLSMSFKTDACSVAEAEDEFTDEAHLLISRLRPDLNTITITKD